MRIADEAQDRYGRKVSWGVEVGSQTGTERILFTHIAVPVMTRLKQPERQVLDTLVDAGVARSRADALAWSVKLVGEHTEEWLAKLRGCYGGGRRFARTGPGSLRLKIFRLKIFSPRSSVLGRRRSAPWALPPLLAVDLFDDFVDRSGRRNRHVVSARVDVDDHVVRHAHRSLALPAVGAFLGVGQASSSVDRR